MNTGVSRVGLPTAGAWVTYGLGSENRNLPGFVVLGNTQGIKGGPLNWSAGFLPTTYQGTLFRSQGSPILNLKRPKDTADEDQRAQLDLLAKLNGEHLSHHAGEPDLSTRIETFELAYRMQMEATDLVDFSQEPAGNPQALRPRGTRVAVVRPEVPAGPPAGGAGSAVRPGLQRRRVGRPQRSAPATTPAIARQPTCRSTDC